MSPKQLRNFITKVIKDHLEGLREAEEPEKSGAMWSAWRARISLLVFDRQELHAKLPGDPISLRVPARHSLGGGGSAVKYLLQFGVLRAFVFS